MDIIESTEHENGDVTYTLDVSIDETQDIFHSFLSNALASYVVNATENMHIRTQLIKIDKFLDSAESTQVRNWVLKKLNKIVERIENEK